jgi:catechol 2,3-dioxygenase-like lactoylglutathione lyase family enzyme
MSDSVTLGIHHLGLAVPNLDEAVSFFTDALGWHVKGRNEEYPAAFVNDGTVTVTLWQIPLSEMAVAFDRRRNIGLHHLAFAVRDFDSLIKVFDRVRAYPGVVIEFEPMQIGPSSNRHHFMCAMSGGIRIEFAMLSNS